MESWWPGSLAEEERAVPQQRPHSLSPRLLEAGGCAHGAGAGACRAGLGGQAWPQPLAQGAFCHKLGRKRGPMGGSTPGQKRSHSQNTGLRFRGQSVLEPHKARSDSRELKS